MSDFTIAPSPTILCAALQLWLNAVFVHEPSFISVDSVSLSYSNASFKITLYNFPPVSTSEEEE